MVSSTMNNCRIPNFQGALMTIIVKHVNMDCSSSSSDEESWDEEYSERCRVEAEIEWNLLSMWTDQTELMTFAYSEEPYYEYQCY